MGQNFFIDYRDIESIESKFMTHHQASSIIVITGASSGIGRELTLNLVSQNLKILAIAQNQKRLEELKSHAPSLIDILSADISKEEDRSKIRLHLSENTKISHLIHSAGLMAPSGPLENISLVEWRKQIGVNVEAPLFLTTELLPLLHNGRILSLTVYCSLTVSVGLASYGISKAALNMLTKYFQAELKIYNIKASSALPGLVATNIQKQLPSNPNSPIRQKVDSLESQTKLLHPKVSAAFLTWLLLKTNDQQFSEKLWDIYDTSHHQFWAQGLKIPKID